MKTADSHGVPGGRASSPGSAAPARRRPRAGGLRELLWPLSCLALGVVAYRALLWFEPEHSLTAEVEEWLFVPTATVTPVVVAVGAWLAYRRRSALARLPDASGWAAAAWLLAAAAALHAWALFTGAVDLQAPSLALTSLGLAALAKGPGALRVMWLPALVLLFAMPLPPPLLNQVVYQLQLWTAEIAGALLAVVGVPHHVAGEQILRASQTFSVIEACSGLRSVESLTIVAVLMVDLFGRRGLHALIVLALAPPVAFLLNGLRALTLILNPHSDLVSVHTAQGVAILLAGLLLLFFVDGWLERLLPRAGASGPPDRDAGASGGDGSAPSGGLPPATASGKAAASGPRPAGVARWPIAGVFLGVLAVASVVVPGPRVELPEGLRLSARLEALFPDRASRQLKTDTLFLGSVGFQENVTRRLDRGDERVEVFIGVGNRADRGHSPISPKTGLPGSGWVVEDRGQALLPPDDTPAEALVLRSGSRRLLAYHWRSGDGGLWSETLRWLLALDTSPWRRKGETIVVRLTTDIAGAAASGRDDAARRLGEVAGRLREFLAGLAAGGTENVFRSSADTERTFHPG